MATFSSHHGLEAGPKGMIHFVDVALGHVGPLILHEGIRIWLRSCTGLALHEAPDPIIQRYCILWGWRPEVSCSFFTFEAGEIVPWPCWGPSGSYNQNIHRFFAFKEGEIVPRPRWGPSGSYGRNISSFLAFEAGEIVPWPRWRPSGSYGRNICSFLAFEVGEIVPRTCWGPSRSYDRNICCF